MLLLGRFGLSEERVGEMTLPELNSFVRQARQLLSTYQSVPVLIPVPSAPPPSPSKPKPSGKGATTYISKRQKK